HIPMKAPPRQCAKKAIPREQYVADPRGGDWPCSHSLTCQQFRLETGIQKRVRLPAAFRSDEEVPGKTIKRFRSLIRKSGRPGESTVRFRYQSCKCSIVFVERWRDKLCSSFGPGRRYRTPLAPPVEDLRTCNKRHY